MNNRGKLCHTYQIQRIKVVPMPYTIIMYCPRCGSRMALNDETTKLNEYTCDNCHATEIEKKTPVAGHGL
jgi:ribosomal protein S27AE